MPQPTTANRGYPQPHPDNTLMTDVERLKQALEMIDQDINLLDNQNSESALAQNEKLRRIRLNSLLGENLFVI